MIKPAPASFSLRTFLIFTAIMAVLCGWRAYSFALAAVMVAALHFLLLFVGLQLAKHYPQGRSRLQRRRFVPRTMADDSAVIAYPVLTAVVYLTLMLTYHMLIILSFRMYWLSAEWYSPSAFGPSLYMLHSCVLIALNLLVVVSFLAHCYGSGKISAFPSLTTAMTSTVLLASHLAVPVL